MMNKGEFNKKQQRPAVLSKHDKRVLAFCKTDDPTSQISFYESDNIMTDSAPKLNKIKKSVPNHHRKVAAKMAHNEACRSCMDPCEDDPMLIFDRTRVAGEELEVVELIEFCIGLKVMYILR